MICHAFLVNFPSIFSLGVGFGFVPAMENAMENTNVFKLQTREIGLRAYISTQINISMRACLCKTCVLIKGGGLDGGD